MWYMQEQEYPLKIIHIFKTGVDSIQFITLNKTTVHHIFYCIISHYSDSNAKSYVILPGADCSDNKVLNMIEIFFQNNG